ncbi:MAG: 50S ribosomal protein L21 [Gammaproteobacteria bacterium]|nr:50S ribosomal protein L21 [Gammaproteobacteria bacterium]MCY4198211.1 50S ribosomal protein L21 [Gammaproteobacteria bacterium]MCY4277333.1 50S ribosomal protein L21 [Gammaproteobacteria bacterium]MCY4323571.1 50S ribosomal protein L21 [Gammaproteobacteria bacterium]
MFAVIESGGKQHRVAEGDLVKLEKLGAAEHGASPTIGSSVQFDQILMMSDKGQIVAGAPHVEGGVVEGEVVSEGRGKKVRIIKFKRRKNYLRRQGHRQPYSEIRITKIQLPAASGVG